MSRARRPGARVFAIQNRTNDGRATPFIVRWRVDGIDFHQAFKKKVGADRKHRQLESAVERGEPFSRVTGLPLSLAPEEAPRVAEWCKQYMDANASSLAPRYRSSIADDLVPLILRSAPDSAPELNKGQRANLLDWLAGRQPLSPGAAAWIERWSPRLAELDKAALSRTMKALQMRQDLTTPLMASTYGKRRAVVKLVLNDAVESGFVKELEWPKSKKGAARKSEWEAPTDDDDVIDQATLLRLIEAHTNKKPNSNRYRCLTALVGLGGLRPSEALELSLDDVDWSPDGASGTLRVQRANISTYKRWMREGEDHSGKPKTKSSYRVVPIGPELVTEIQRWATRRGVASGPLFNDGPGGKSWPDALSLACSKIGIENLSRYDLRRARASHLIAQGLDIVTVADIMGHSPRILLDHYAKLVRRASGE